MNTNKKKLEPIFICGHRKSGTTLYLNLFDNHKDIFTYPHDLNIFYALEKYFKFKQISSNVAIYNRLKKVIFSDLRKKKELKNILNLNNLENFFFHNLKKKKLNIKNIFNTLILTFKNTTENKNNKIVCKETSLEIYFEELLKIWPNAKFIQVIRDPRDNIGAIMDGLENRYKKFNDNRESIIFSSIFRLKYGLELGNYFLHKYPNNFYQSKFENLINNPSKELKKICIFANIKYHKSMHHPTVMGVATPGNSHNFEKMYKLSNKNIRNWNKRLSKNEIKIIEFNLSNMFKLYNYKPQFKYDDSISVLPKFYNDINYKYFYYDRF